MKKQNDKMKMTLRIAPSEVGVKGVPEVGSQFRWGTIQAKVISAKKHQNGWATVVAEEL